jgi:two-component system response regulator RegA
MKTRVLSEGVSRVVGAEREVCGRDIRSVLIVDDERSARRQLERGFQTLGIETRSIDNLQEARDFAVGHSPDLALVELGPVAALGLELVEALRQRLPEIRIVIITSYGSVASAVLSVRRGADHYLCKPVSAPLILASLGASDLPSAPDAARTSSTAMMTLDQAIWEYLHHAVEMSGSMAEAARRLGLWRQSLRRMLNKYRPPDVAASHCAASEQVSAAGRRLTST